MRALLYQPSAGISGDMHLGAMVDLGVPESHLQAQLARLPLAEEFRVSFSRGAKMGVSGTRAHVEDLGGSHQDHTDAHAHGHEHRHYGEIHELISGSGFAPGIEVRAQAIFREIANAEAKIHDVPVDDVHFHEVGAVDSIVDVVAAAICLDWLNVERVYCDTIEVGSGYVNCAHGHYPVPAPATQEILTGMSCHYAGVQGESTTPTGAAILKASVDENEVPRRFVPQRIGYGLGMKDFEVPNVLRVVLGEVDETAAIEAHFKIEANIDDMSPEAFEPLIEHLLDIGASDVYLLPVVMKKSRPATCLSVLCESARVDALADAILNRSTTIGLRVLPFEKRVLPREERRIETSLGEVRVKLVTRPDGGLRWKSEHDDVRRLADGAGLDYLDAKKRIDQEIANVIDI